MFYWTDHLTLFIKRLLVKTFVVNLKKNYLLFKNIWKDLLKLHCTLYSYIVQWLKKLKKLFYHIYYCTKFKYWLQFELSYLFKLNLLEVIQ